MPRDILDARGVTRCLRRMASQILDEADPGVPLALVGIRAGGVPLAQRLADCIEQAEGIRPQVGAVDITLYRDDLHTGLEKAPIGATELPFDLSGTGVFLIDDVVYTGRSVRAALDVLHDYGRPRWIRLAVLVDRGGRELPIQADVVGRTVDVGEGEKVVVTVGERDSVVLESSR